ncbi:MAG: hypothetical protein CMM58_07795 [Rhodospirillaceae bacterium]|nr:hypothetical protein [Rhodospirillaceae bacterium]
MRELIRTNDIVQLSFIVAHLKSEGIESYILDNHTSIIEGSANAIPRRLMVSSIDYFSAKKLLGELGE